MEGKRARGMMELSKPPNKIPADAAAGSAPLGRRVFSLRNVASFLLAVAVLYLVYPEFLGVDWGEVWASVGGGEPGAVRARPRDLLLLVSLARPALEGAARQPRLRPSRRAAHALGPRTDQDYVRSLVRQLRYRRPPRRRLPRVPTQERSRRLLRRDARHRPGRAAPGPRGAGGDDGRGRAGGLRPLAADRSPPGAHRRPDPLGRRDGRAPGDATVSAGGREGDLRHPPHPFHPPPELRP